MNEAGCGGRGAGGQRFGSGSVRALSTLEAAKTSIGRSGWLAVLCQMLQNRVSGRPFIS